MTELSHDAQAVMDAYYSRNKPLVGTRRVAAALRVISEFARMDQPLGDTDADAGVFAAHQAIYGYITAIADELEGTQ